MIYTLKLDADVINQIALALQDVSFKVASPIFAEIQKQVNEQNAAVQANVQDTAPLPPHPSEQGQS